MSRRVRPSPEQMPVEAAFLRKPFLLTKLIDEVAAAADRAEAAVADLSHATEITLTVSLVEPKGDPERIRSHCEG
jgi:hypothetical protein